MLWVKVGAVTGFSRHAFTKVSSCCCHAHCPVTQSRGSASTPAGDAVIRIPRSMQTRIESVKQTRGAKNKIHTIKAGKLLIQSRNPELNQAAGFTRGRFHAPVLCSGGWKHDKSFGDYFTINRIKSVAPSVEDTRRDDEEPRPSGRPSVSFEDLRLCGTLVDTLKKVKITRPTAVQLQTVPKVLQGHNVLCAAETGSGKTLSYLLPIVHTLQADKEWELHGEDVHRTRAVVVVPSRELAEQVASVSRSLCAPLGLRTSGVGGGRGVGHIKAVLRRERPHVLVSTPGALVKALRRSCLDVGRLSFVVVDEADTMFDPSFSAMLEDILLRTNISTGPRDTRGPARKAQLLVVGATFPGGVGEVLSQVTDLGSVVVLKSKMLHFLMPHVKQTFLKVKGKDKILELHRVLKENRVGSEGGGAALVFCNKSSTVNWLGYSLEELGVLHARLQGHMPAAVRSGIFRSFQKGQTDVLVCTDIASRGLDTSRVRLVVNYDAPESLTDYIHRAGRVGRAGGVEGGEVLTLVTHPWDVELVQSIETAARRKTSLPGMETQIHQPKARVQEEVEEEVEE